MDTLLSTFTENIVDDQQDQNSSQNDNVVSKKKMKQRKDKKQENYAVISKPNLTYQKASNIFKNYLLEELNRINILKYKIEEKFPLIHYIYLLLFSKIYNRTNNSK